MKDHLLIKDSHPNINFSAMSTGFIMDIFRDQIPLQK